MSAPFTVGVEEEYQLVDPEGGALRDAAPRLLEADWSEDVRAEIHRSTVEVGTPVCASGREVAEELRRLRLTVAAVAASEGLRIAAAGVHPYSRWEGRAQTEGERYREITRLFGRISRDEHNFGMHIHVGLPEGVDRIAVLNGVRRYLPHLLALSCSSPFHEGADTGYASYRTILWRRWPVSSVPPAFGDEAEYRRFLGLLLAAGTLPDEASIYWSVRLHSTYPTIEFRVTDVCPRVADAAALGALARVLAAAVVSGELSSWEPSGLSASVDRELIATNEWSAARFGLETRLLDAARPEGQPVRAALEALLERLAPTFQDLGEDWALGGLADILERGNGADGMRQVHRESASLPAVVAWLQEETLLGTGLDRRTQQRPEET